MNYLPSREVLDTLIKKWGSEPSTTCKPRSDHYNRVMRILYGTYPEYNKWLENPYMKKQMEMNLGNFIQDYIGNLKNHYNYGTGHETGLDGCNTNDAGLFIQYEMKIDDHTTNSSSLKKSIEKLQENAKKYGSVPLLIQFFRVRKVSDACKFKEYLISGDEYLNKYVSSEIGGIEGLISHMEMMR
jgi:hypothetical protein